MLERSFLSRHPSRIIRVMHASATDASQQRSRGALESQFRFRFPVVRLPLGGLVTLRGCHHRRCARLFSARVWR